MVESGISGWFRDGNLLTLEEFPDDTLLVLEDYLNRRGFLQVAAYVPVCTENLIRVDDVMESPKLAE